MHKLRISGAAGATSLTLSLALSLALAGGLSACVVETRVTSGQGNLCASDLDCSAGQRCALVAGTGESRCVTLDGADGGPGPDTTGGQDRLLPADRQGPDGGPPPDGAGPDARDGRGDGGPPPVDGPPEACTPNTAVCQDIGHYRTCDRSGSALGPVTACDPGLRCEAGACVDAGRITGGLSLVAFRQRDFGTTEITRGGLSAAFSYNNDPLQNPTSYPPAGSCRQDLISTSSTSNAVPFDAGSISVTGIDGGDRLLAFIDAETGYQATPGVDASSQFPFGRTLSFEGAGGGLIGGFSGQIEVPPQRIIQQPSNLGTVQPGQDLPVTWSGATGQGTLRLQLIASPAADPNPESVTCTVDDTGSFTIPAQFTNLPSGSPASVILIDVRSTPLEAVGLDDGYANSAAVHQREFVFQSPPPF